MAEVREIFNFRWCVNHNSVGWSRDTMCELARLSGRDGPRLDGCDLRRIYVEES